MIAQAMVTVQQDQTDIVTSQVVRLASYVEDFLAALDVAKSSRDTYGRQLKKFEAWLEETGRASKLNTLQREDILEYREDLESQGLSVFSVNGYLVAVRKLFEWLESEKVYPNIAKVKGLKKPKGFMKDTLTPDQLREALEAIDRSSLEGLRDYALFNLMARTGLRDIEVSRALIGDLRQESGQAVLWIQGKGRSTADEFVLLVEETERPLREWLQARAALADEPPGDEEPLFCSLSNNSKGQALTTRSISRIVKNRLRAIGLDKRRLTAHSLRHTAITLALAGGASLQQAQAMARHEDPKTTMIYARNLARIQAGAEKFISF